MRTLPGFCTLLFALLVASPAPALTIFDFEDVPSVGGSQSPDPATFVYQCEGKSYCSYLDLFRAAFTGYTSIATQRAGIALTLHGTSVFQGTHLTQALSPGNFQNTFDNAAPFYLAGFSLPLDSVQVDLAPALGGAPGPGLYELFLAAYDGPQGSGALLSRTSRDLFLGPTTLSLVAPGTRSIVFGSVGLPGSGCLWCMNSAVADNIAVAPVPEPSSGALGLLACALVLGAAKRGASAR
jgi:hypothetical protein